MYVEYLLKTDGRLSCVHKHLDNVAAPTNDFKRVIMKRDMYICTKS